MISRRQLLQKSATVSGSLYALGGLNSKISLAGTNHDPHFFVLVYLPGGFDNTYLHDARPLSMLNAQKHANYLKEEPSVLQGKNGGTALVTRFFKPLEAHMDHFSLVNGVMMTPTFDGHENNIGFLLTGNPFGGESFLPHLNTTREILPLDSIRFGVGNVLTNIENNNASIPLSVQSKNALVQKVTSLKDLNAESRTIKFLRDRYAALGSGVGRRSAGTRAMHAGLAEMVSLKDRLLNIPTDEGTGESFAMSAAKTLGAIFKAGVSRTSMVVFDTDLSQDQNLDTHSGSEARKMPALTENLSTQVAQLISYFRDTPFDDRRSLLDVTTIIVTSEFARTLKGYGPFAESGTDHNPLTNSVFIGGKGIKAGQVIGASDFVTPTEVLSPAHLRMDPSAVRHMAQPFDFANATPRSDKPETFKQEDYLTFSHLVNTVYDMFSVDAKFYRTLIRNGPAVPSIKQLLQNV